MLDFYTENKQSGQKITLQYEMGGSRKYINSEINTNITVMIAKQMQGVDYVAMDRDAATYFALNRENVGRVTLLLDRAMNGLLKGEYDIKVRQVSIVHDPNKGNEEETGNHKGEYSICRHTVDIKEGWCNLYVYMKSPAHPGKDGKIIPPQENNYFMNLWRMNQQVPGLVDYNPEAYILWQSLLEYCRTQITATGLENKVRTDKWLQDNQKGIYAPKEGNGQNGGGYSKGKYNKYQKPTMSETPQHFNQQPQQQFVPPSVQPTMNPVPSNAQIPASPGFNANQFIQPIVPQMNNSVTPAPGTPNMNIQFKPFGQ